MNYSNWNSLIIFQCLSNNTTQPPMKPPCTVLTPKVPLFDSGCWILKKEKESARENGDRAKELFWEQTLQQLLHRVKTKHPQMFPWSITQHKALTHQMETTMSPPLRTHTHTHKLGGGCNLNKAILQTQARQSPLLHRRLNLELQTDVTDFAYGIFSVSDLNVIQNGWTCMFHVTTN